MQQVKWSESGLVCTGDFVEIALPRGKTRVAEVLDFDEQADSWTVRLDGTFIRLTVRSEQIIL